MRQFIAAILAVALAAGVTSGQVVTFTTIANSSSVAPGGGTFSALSPPSIDGSRTAFWGRVNGNSAIFTSAGGTIATLLPSAALIPNGTGNFANYYAALNYQNGTATFSAYGYSSSGAYESGVYVADGSTVKRVADQNTSVPGGSANFSDFYSTSPAIDGTNVAFQNGGIYISQGGTSPALTTVADRQTVIPGGPGAQFTVFGDPAMSGNRVVFWGGGSSRQGGVYERVGDGSLAAVADQNTPLPGGGGTFPLGITKWNVALSGSNIAFANPYYQGGGVYARINGNLTKIADTSTAAPDGTGNFYGLRMSQSAGMK
jgi:hypothetical protein